VSNQSSSVALIETVADVDKLNLDNKQLSYTTQTTLSIDDTQPIWLNFVCTINQISVFLHFFGNLSQAI
jgi:4-hydroxy-3-methylbut-2-enyl diphosphate reductase IspH